MSEQRLVPIKQLFLKSFISVINPGGLVILLDNNYVEGSSTPIHYTDESGNAYQKRKLMDGSEYSIIKNFPTYEELLTLIKSVGTKIEISRFEYYWAVKFYKT